MDMETIKKLLTNRNIKWELHSYSGDKSSFDFTYTDTPSDCVYICIHCVVYPKTNEFEFIYVTSFYFKLSSGTIGSFDNDKHFDLFFQKFLKEVLLLAKD